MDRAAELFVNEFDGFGTGLNGRFGAAPVVDVQEGERGVVFLGERERVRDGVPGGGGEVGGAEDAAEVRTTVDVGTGGEDGTRGEEDDLFGR